MCVNFTRPKDVGRPKADVAADFINSRIPGCCVVPYPLDPRTMCVCVCGGVWFKKKKVAVF